jgi:hypothetical protein
VTAGAYAHTRGSTGGGLDRHRAVRMIRWPGGSTLPGRYTYAGRPRPYGGSLAWEDLWMWRFGVPSAISAGGYVSPHIRV